MSLAALKLQQRRRDQERVLHDTQAFIDQQENTQRLHDWEARTQKSIDARQIDKITHKLIQEDEDELDQRKQQLQSLYNGEMAEWKQTLQESLEVTQEEKMEQIRSRAYELKAKREAERQAFVKQCYERQWVDACDDLRAFESKATLNRLTKDRMIQMQCCSDENKPPTQSDTVAMLLIDKDESVEQAQRRQAALQFRHAIDQQVAWKKSQADALSKQVQLEEKEQLKQLATLEAKAKEEERELTEKTRREGRDLLEETRQRDQEREVLRNMEREQNILLLEHAIDNEQRQIQIELAKKEVGKHAASEYVQCLREQLKDEAKENEEITHIRNNELDRIEKMRDEKAKAEEDARRRWMEEVDVTRREQTRRKKLEAEGRSKEEAREVEEIKDSLLKAEEEEMRSAKKADTLRLETMLENKRTIEQRAKERERERHDKYLIQQQRKKVQERYQQRLEDKKKSYGVGDLI